MSAASATGAGELVGDNGQNPDPNPVPFYPEEDRDTERCPER